MGNKLSRPVIKERPLAFVRRKLGLMTRKDKIERLVRLTVLNDEEKLRSFAAQIDLTQEELQTYYDEIEAYYGEYCTYIPEIEYRSDTSTPEYEDFYLSSSSSLASSSGSSDSSPLAVDNFYKDPEIQKEFEEYCRLRYGKKKDTRNNVCNLASKRGPIKTDNMDTQMSKNMQVVSKIKDKATGNDRAHALDRAVLQPMSGGDVKLPAASNAHQNTSLKLSVAYNTVKCDDRSSPSKGPSRMLGKINEGLMTRKDGKDKAKPPRRTSVAPPNKCKQESGAQDKEVPVKVNTASKLNTDAKLDNDDNKPGFIRRCINTLKRKTESVVSNRQVIKVKPATPENTIKNHRTNATKRKISQSNLKPDRGIVWPSDLEGLSTLNKAYYVEQFLRTELFKQRCKRKEKGGKTWKNGLSKFQLWVVENEGTDAIDAVLDIVPKNRTNAKAKVKCWRGDTPPPAEC